MNNPRNVNGCQMLHKAPLIGKRRQLALKLSGTFCFCFVFSTSLFAKELA